MEDSLVRIFLLVYRETSDCDFLETSNIPQDGKGVTFYLKKLKSGIKIEVTPANFGRAK